MTFIEWLTLLSGVVLGVTARAAWGDTRYAIGKEEFDNTTAEQGKEIARLRAQVANLIGKE